jgi:hypothetical protein
LISKPQILQARRVGMGLAYSHSGTDIHGKNSEFFP